MNKTNNAEIYPGGAQSGQGARAPFAVYVAAAAAPEAARRVTSVIAALRADGFNVTCTWPQNVAAVGQSNPRDAGAVDRRGWAVRCFNEIDISDAVLCLVPTLPVTTCGAWWEASYAYSERKHLLCAGDTKQTVFCALGHEFDTDAGAIRYLHELRNRARAPEALNELATIPALDLRLKDALVTDPAQPLNDFDLGGES